MLLYISMAKLVKKNRKTGKLDVNKAAVMAELRKKYKSRSAGVDEGVPVLMHASQNEIDAEVAEITRYSAEQFLNLNEL